MPEVVRGIRHSVDAGQRTVGFDTPPATALHASPSRKSVEFKDLERRRSNRPEDRPPAQAYYDSRAATKREFNRRGSTLAEYYEHHPTLLPQLPFTWHHGWRRVKLGLLITLMFIDACVIPLVLYYTMKFAGHVQGWIVFAVVATIWGGPTYLEFAVRSWRLIKKEDFYRPLGAKGRWGFDFVSWLSVFSIAAVTSLLIVGSAPHIVWLRVLSLPGPALLLCLGSGIMFVTTLALLKKPAPFRISSTGKGEPVLPGVLYLIEDVVAVNASAGRPYREALHARYNASPRFRQMVMDQSLFWGIPAILIGGALIVVVCVHEVDKEIAYGLGWGIPFFWALIWAFLSVIWVKKALRNERIAWEEDNDGDLHDAKRLVLDDQPLIPGQAGQTRHSDHSATSTSHVDVAPPSGGHDEATQDDAQINKRPSARAVSEEAKSDLTTNI
ncbi:hypothetical protein DV735_g4779, partial [Chaetothyriales sp. CBS 134920]